MLPNKVYAVLEIKHLRPEAKTEQDPVKKEVNKEEAMILSAQNALKQLKDKNYSAKYKNKATDVVEVGVVIYHRRDIKVVFAKN
jgi:hypothetical protein